MSVGLNAAMFSKDSNTPSPGGTTASRTHSPSRGQDVLKSLDRLQADLRTHLSSSSTSPTAGSGSKVVGMPSSPVRNLFDAADCNRDGVISRQEFKNLFDTLDRNKDGVITRGELGLALAHPQPAVAPQDAIAPLRDFDTIKLESYQATQESLLKTSALVQERGVAIQQKNEELEKMHARLGETTALALEWEGLVKTKDAELESMKQQMVQANRKNNELEADRARLGDATALALEWEHVIRSKGSELACLKRNIESLAGKKSECELVRSRFRDAEALALQLDKLVKSKDADILACKRVLQAKDVEIETCRQTMTAARVRKEKLVTQVSTKSTLLESTDTRLMEVTALVEEQDEMLKATSTSWDTVQAQLEEAMALLEEQNNIMYAKHEEISALQVKVQEATAAAEQRERQFDQNSSLIKKCMVEISALKNMKQEVAIAVAKVPRQEELAEEWLPVSLNSSVRSGRPMSASSRPASARYESAGQPSSARYDSAEQPSSARPASASSRPMSARARTGPEVRLPPAPARTAAATTTVTMGAEMATIKAPPSRPVSGGRRRPPSSWGTARNPA
jgi:hypothetical protein